MAPSGTPWAASAAQAKVERAGAASIAWWRGKPARRVTPQGWPGTRRRSTSCKTSRSHRIEERLAGIKAHQGRAGPEA